MRADPVPAPEPLLAPGSALDALTVDRVVAGYGSAPVLHGLSLAANAGEITVVLGANGVGKTTMLRTVSGLLFPWKGTVSFSGHILNRLHAEARVRLGIGMVPEPPAVFRNLSVRDNLRVGALPLGRARQAAEGRLEATLSEFPLLARRLRQLAGSLSGGEQRMLALARALMAEPRLLLVDEPSMGLSPTMVDEVLALLRGLRERGLSVCMVEQHAAALDIADRAYVLEQGRVVHTTGGAGMDELRDQAARLYLGATRRHGRR
jgi:ABC-type branched-subunit amino acid transport system ATPase component